MMIFGVLALSLLFFFDVCEARLVRSMSYDTFDKGHVAQGLRTKWMEKSVLQKTAQSHIEKASVTGTKRAANAPAPLVMPNENGQSDYLIAVLFADGGAGTCNGFEGEPVGGVGIALELCVENSLYSSSSLYVKATVENFNDFTSTFDYKLTGYDDSECLSGATTLADNSYTSGDVCYAHSEYIFKPYAGFSLEKEDFFRETSMALLYNPGNSKWWDDVNGLVQFHYDKSGCPGNVAAVEIWNSNACMPIPSDIGSTAKSAKLHPQGCGNNIEAKVLWDLYTTTDCTGSPTTYYDYEFPSDYCSALNYIYLHDFPFELDGTYDACVGNFKNQCEAQCPDAGMDTTWTIGCGGLTLRNEKNWCEFDGSDYCCHDCCVANGGAIAGVVIGVLIFLTCSIILCCACCGLCPHHDYWHRVICCGKKEEPVMTTVTTGTTVTTQPVQTPHGEMMMTSNPMARQHPLRKK